jgi:hypothetical protein
MVFKRKASRRYPRSMKRSRSRKSSSGLTPMNVLLAGAVYGAARPFAAKLLPDFFSFGPIDSHNAIIGAAGIYGMKKGSGFTKALGVVAAGSEAGIVAARVTSNTAQNVATAGTDAYEY